MSITNGPKDEKERAKLRAMIREIKDSLPKKPSQESAYYVVSFYFNCLFLLYLPVSESEYTYVY